MRKMIYVPGPVIWDEIILAAKAQGRSVSNYLIQLHVEHGRHRGLNESIRGMSTDIEGLISDRQKAFKDGNIERAEKFEAELSESGVKVEDRPEGTAWKKEPPIEKSKGDLRAKWKASHPRDLCPGCRNYNKDCTCFI